MSTTGETGMTARAVSTGAPAATPTDIRSGTTQSLPTQAPTAAPSAAAASARPAGVNVSRGRRVKLTVSRVDPWSAMKMSFLLSVALGIAMVVMVAVLWTILAGMGVFDQVDSIIAQVLSGSQTKPFSIKDFIGFGRVVSLSIVIAVLDVVIMTAIATLGAFLYNVCSALVGGLQLTLTDD